MSNKKPRAWDKQVQQALAHYNRTGELRDILLTGFDQNGKWCDLLLREDADVFDPELTEKISSIKIPAKQITYTSDTGEITLRTSYISKSRQLVEVPYDHILGNLFVFEATSIVAPKLKSVRGGIGAISAKSFRAPLLESVEDFFDADESVEFHAPNLRFVGHNLNIPNAYYANSNLVVKGEWTRGEASTQAYVCDLMQKMLAAMFPNQPMTRIEVKKRSEKSSSDGK